MNRGIGNYEEKVK